MNVQEAVEKAVAALKEAFVNEALHDLKLEEVEREDGESAWYITLGFDRAVDLSPLISGGVHQKWNRVYKVVKLNPETGEAEFIKMRENVG